MKHRVVIYGPTIVRDSTLIGLIKRKSDAILAQDTRQLEEALAAADAALLVVEFAEDFDVELGRLQKYRVEYPSLKIIVVDGGQNAISVVKVFKGGADDFFQKPYDPLLLAERIEAMGRERF
ncbi:hypothetical protein JXO59_01395 [candidate division KSB1 bacterium]|nr:hypothetical protein [candidate division KSB1 bacterium]